MNKHIIVINEGSRLEEHKTKSGKSRFTVTIEAEPVVHNFDPHLLGAPVAQAIAHHYRKAIEAISAIASPATLKAREVEQRAFRAGKPWAMRRNAGGRIGAMEPNQTDRIGNSSGRFAKSITANAGKKDPVWRINVAANRLNPQIVGTVGVQRIWQKLTEHVPELRDPRLLLQNDVVRASIRRAQNEAIKKARKTTEKIGTQVAQGLFKTLQNLADIASALAS